MEGDVSISGRWHIHFHSHTYNNKVIIIYTGNYKHNVSDLRLSMHIYQQLKVATLDDLICFTMFVIETTIVVLGLHLDV